MPVFTLEGPNGQRVKIEAPDRETALRGAQEYAASGGKVRAGTAAQSQREPVFQPGRDLINATVPAWTKMVEGFRDDYRKTTSPGAFKDDPLGLKANVRTLRNVGNVAGVGLGVVQAPFDALVSGPIGRLMARAPLPTVKDAEANKQYINSALMGAKPRPGLFGGSAPRPIPAPVPRPNIRAEQVVRRAIERDMRQPVDVVAAARSQPSGAPAFQAGGQNVRGLAEVLAKSPGAGGEMIPRAVRDFQAGATDRVGANIATSLGGRNDYFSTLDALTKSRAAQVEPFRQRAFAAPIDPKTYTDSIAPLMSRLPRGALDQAVDIARKDGVDPVELGMFQGPDGAVQVQMPTMQTLHYVKKGIDQTLEQYRNQVTGRLDLSGAPSAQADSRVRAALGQAMRQANPDYDQFMRVWGDESDQLSALSLGRDVFSPKMDMQSEALAKQIADMSDVSREMFRKGVGEAVLAKSRSTQQGGVGAARQLLRTREFGDRVRLAFPEQKGFDDFMAALDREVTMQDVGNRIIGGSPTYPLQAARGDLEAQAAGPVDAAAFVLDGGLSPNRIAAAGIRAIPRKDRSVVGDPVANEALSKALIDPEELAKILSSTQANRERRDAILRALALRTGQALPPLLAAPEQSTTGR